MWHLLRYEESTKIYFAIEADCREEADSIFYGWIENPKNILMLRKKLEKYASSSKYFSDCPKNGEPHTYADIVIPKAYNLTEMVKSEDDVQRLVIKALKKEFNPNATIANMDFIKHVLQTAQNAGISYDISWCGPSIKEMACNSENHKERCMEIYKLLNLKFKKER